MKFAVNNLLISSTAKTVIIAVVCVLGAALLLYGAIRRFSRSSWTGLQIVVLFFIALGVTKIPFFGNRYTYFGVIAGSLLACIAAILIFSSVMRWILRTRNQKPNWGFRVFNHIFGALNAVVNLAVPVIAIGGIVLAVLYYCTSLPQGALSAVYNHTLWTSLGKYAPDFTLVAFLTVSVKGGYKLGLLKSIWTVMMMVLTVVALVGSVYIAIKMPGISTLSEKLTALFAGRMNGVLAKVLGYGIVSIVTFVVLMILIVLLNLLINLGVREMDKIRFFRFFDGALFALIVFAVSCVLVAGVHFAVYSVAHAALPAESPAAEENVPSEVSLAEESTPETPSAEEAPPQATEEEGKDWPAEIWEKVQTYFANHNVEALFTSSPVSNFFYTYNPILTITGKA